LEACGVADGIKAIAQEPTVLGSALSTLQQHAAWWRQTGLDYKKILTTRPGYLHRSVDSLQDKLDFLRNVVRMSDDDLNKATALFNLSLEERLRPRFFYVLWKKRADEAAHRRSYSSLMCETDHNFVAGVLGRSRYSPVSAAEMASYKETVTSAEFVAWREREEALLRSGVDRGSAKL
jgi:hypothetical protein